MPRVNSRPSQEKRLGRKEEPLTGRRRQSYVSSRMAGEGCEGVAGSRSSIVSTYGDEHQEIMAVDARVV